MRYFVLASVAMFAVATPAYAQDADPTFTGFHVEAIGGLDHIKGSTNSATGGLYGAAAGFDIASNKVVFGVEGEVTGSTSRNCATSVFVANDTLCEKAGRDLYAGGRIGVIVAPKTMLYIKGGYTNARDRATYTTGATTVTAGQNLDGVRGGIGLETDVGHLLVKIEYRYSNYEQDFERHQGVVGLGFRF